MRRAIRLPLFRCRLRLSRPRRSLGNWTRERTWLWGWLVEIERVGGSEAAPLLTGDVWCP